MRLQVAGRILLEAGPVLACALLGWRMPFAGLGWMEAVFASLTAYFWLRPAFAGRSLVWSWLGMAAALTLVFSWVARTIAVKGGLPYPVALAGTALFYAYEAAGLTAALAAARWAWRRTGRPMAAGVVAAFAVLLWEAHGFHVYQWGWGATLGGVPFLARAAAFVGSHGLTALVWGCATAAAALRAAGRPWRAVLGPPALGLALLGVLSTAWHLLPRGPERELDVVMVQPNFESGLRRPGMETDMWLRSDRVLAARNLPRPGTPTLLLWPESAILGRNDLSPDPRHREEARRRGVAWLFGTEGGEPGWRYLSYNLVRGEAEGAPSLALAKIEPMPFGERMPGPPWLRDWLDARLGFASAVAGRLGPEAFLAVPAPGGPIRVHPLICSEALLPGRVQAGVSLTGADLLSNHTNDGWFDRSVATDLHAAQIRLRAVEAGVPLLRSTLTGKSGVFREDGSWVLWGGPLTEAEHAFTLRWRPVRTPARSPHAGPLLLAALGAAALLLAWRGRARP